MQRRTKVIGAAAIVALVAAGGSAFTASNSVPPDKKLGYGETTVSGANVTGMAFNQGTTANDVATIVYNLAPTDTTTNANPVIKVKVGPNSSSLTQYDCTVTTPSSSSEPQVSGVITCTTTNLTVANTVSVQLVVTPA